MKISKEETQSVMADKTQIVKNFNNTEKDTPGNNKSHFVH